MAYTEKETRELIELYESNPCLEMVSRLAVRFNKPKKSIIGKLSKEGVYQKLGYRSKTGAVPITKLAIVRLIEDDLGVLLPELDKTPKVTLTRLKDAIHDQSNALEEALNTIVELKHLADVRGEMLQNK